MTIKELREEKGLSQKAFAEAIGMKTPTIGAYEQGRIKPSEAVLAKIKEIYGVDVTTPAEQASPAEGAKPTKRTSQKKKEEAGSAPVPVEEAKPKKRGGRKKAAPAEQPAAAETAPAVEEKKPTKRGKKKDEQPAVEKKAAAPAPAPEEVKPKKRTRKGEEAKPAKRGKKTEATPKVVIQSPMGGSITPEEVLAKTGPVDSVYIRVDENKAYWVKGEETGSVDLW
jgi:transcriptional regulator with XRE-family HTH domain